MRYTKHTTTTNTPVTEPLLGLNQVKNNAGGYVFATTDRVQLERFLTLGSEGGTFYVQERKLTQDNAKTIIAMIQRNGLETVQTIVDFSKANRTPKQDPAIFALALACTYGDAKTKAAAYNAIVAVCRTSTHLFSFCQAIQDMRGWSRGLRTGVENWYRGKSVESLAYQLAKYRQRNGWTHRDVLRLTHPKPIGTLSDLYKYAVGKPNTADKQFAIIEGFEAAQKGTNSLEVAKLIEKYGLTWEMIPTEMLNQPVVLDALLQKMPVTAMIRNLNRFATVGLTMERTSDATRHIVKTLTDKEKLIEGRVHPVTLLNSVKVYGSGHGFRGGKTWTPNQAIIDALETAFDLSFEAVEPTGKNILVAVDVSGSMGAPISNMALTCTEAAAGLVMTFLRSEPNVDVVYFDTTPVRCNIGKRSSFQEVFRDLHPRGGTDCSVPFQYALKNATRYDAIITLTDSETWHGGHPIAYFEQYRKQYNVNCKGIVVAMVANEFSLFPSTDINCLQVAGFDASVPTLVNNFIKQS